MKGALIMLQTELIQNERKIDIYLDYALSKLGLNFANIGTRYFKELVKLAYFNADDLNLKYKDLCIRLGNRLNVNPKKISSNIYSSISSANIDFAKKNFQSIFYIEFDIFFLTPKHLSILLVNILNRKSQSQ